MLYVLVGMPGSGKSCMARAMSKKLGMEMIDADKLIEQREGKELHEIIRESGLDEFKRIEEEVLLSIDSDKDVIVATGGSAVYYERAMTRFKEIGKVIYLYVSFETMKERIGDFSKRGIAMRPDQTIKDVYDEREALYRRYASIIIDCDGTDYYEYRNSVARAINYRKTKNKIKQK